MWVETSIVDRYLTFEFAELVQNIYNSLGLPYSEQFDRDLDVYISEVRVLPSLNTSTT